MSPDTKTEPRVSAELARGKAFVLETFDQLNQPEGEAFKRRWLDEEFASVRERDAERQRRTLEIFYESSVEEISFTDALLIAAGSERSAEARKRIERRIRQVMKKLRKAEVLEVRIEAPPIRIGRSER